MNEERVDLVVITGNCESHSRRNHNRNARDQHTSLKDIWAALGYVRKQSPKAVIVENVTDASSVSAITGLLGRLAGYSLERGMLDPRDVADMPVARERMFWLKPYWYGRRRTARAVRTRKRHRGGARPTCRAGRATTRRSVQ